MTDPLIVDLNPDGTASVTAQLDSDLPEVDGQRVFLRPPVRADQPAPPAYGYTCCVPPAVRNLGQTGHRNVVTVHNMCIATSAVRHFGCQELWSETTVL
jgi:hypothetical protein